MDFADCLGLAEGMVFHIETNVQDCFGVREQAGRGEVGVGGVGMIRRCGGHSNACAAWKVAGPLGGRGENREGLAS